MAASIHSFARVLPFSGEQRSSLVPDWPKPAERRLKFRYPLGLTIRFRSSSPVSFSGQGTAVNLCSGGVLVASEQQITVGALVEMSIEWPSMIDGRIPLQLTAVGRILRREICCGESRFAATFERYEFRTHNPTLRTANPQPLIPSS
jgi:hypothetical protein